MYVILSKSLTSQYAANAKQKVYLLIEYQLRLPQLILSKSVFVACCKIHDYFFCVTLDIFSMSSWIDLGQRIFLLKEKLSDTILLQFQRLRLHMKACVFLLCHNKESHGLAAGAKMLYEYLEVIE